MSGNEGIIKRIEMRLAELGMPKEEFYRKAEITSATFSHWNTGKHSPRTKKLQTIADILKISMQYLLTGEEEQKNKPTVNDDELTSEFIKLFSQLSPDEQEREIAFLRSRVNG